MPVFIHDLHQGKEYGLFNNLAEKLAMHFWPGALTIIVPLINNNISAAASSVYNTIALRIPNNELILQILKKFQKPIVATSANFSGQTPYNSASDIFKNFGEKISIIFEHKSKNDNNSIIPSTIIDLTNNTLELVREGLIPFHEITALLEHKTEY